jgi:hypothetical protein
MQSAERTTPVSTNQPTNHHSFIHWAVQTNDMFRNACGTTTAMDLMNMNKCWPASACIAHAHQTHSCGHPALVPSPHSQGYSAEWHITSMCLPRRTPSLATPCMRKLRRRRHACGCGHPPRTFGPLSLMDEQSFQLEYPIAGCNKNDGRWWWVQSVCTRVRRCSWLINILNT